MAASRSGGLAAFTLARLKAAGGEVWRAYTLKEAVRGIFEPGLSLEDVTILIDRLLSRLARSRLEPFVRPSACAKRGCGGDEHDEQRRAKANHAAIIAQTVPDGPNGPSGC